MIMKRIASLALSLVLLLGCLPAAMAVEDGPSPWAEEEVSRAVEVGLVPQSLQEDWQQPMTRGEFAMMVIRYLAVTYGRTDEQLVNDYMTYCPDRNGEFWGEEDFGDGLTWWQRFSDEKSGSCFTDLPTGEQRGYIQAAYHMGLVNGKGDGTLYDPEGTITRQEAACLLARVYQKLDPEDHRIALYSGYTDYSEMATWAIDSIASVVGLDIMGSTSASALTFDPLGTYSREQAAVTFLRLYEDAPVSAAKGNVIKLEEAAYQQELWEVFHKGDPGTNIPEFQADTPWGTVLAIRHRNMMHFSEELLVIYRDGRVQVLSAAKMGSDWSMNDSQDVFSYTVDGVQYQLDLTTRQVTPRSGS